ncbi:putative 6-phosphofructo-2-kinase PB17E12.14c [Candida viswanathii]|uniref:Putative 6-phosphofructo-2-kinase PB17E12.14c n=1 Tax=Candida viswanathii TaxID=5486 RepID=A0A367XT66_9ASCO|nr:putative 6-phosphofructo-2-kinase PB17E12.14c [Candida viswanathii]
MTNNHKVTFDFFDINTPMQQSQRNKQLPPISTSCEYEYSTSPNSPNPANLKFINSSSSLNSLFDNAPPYNRSTSTATITPVLSRNDSNLFKANYSLVQQFHPTIQELEFTKTVDSKLLQHSQKQQQQHQQKLIVVLVGLPASGKSTVCKQLEAFINTSTPFKSHIYNAGDVRRRKSCSEFNDAKFFDPKNEQGKRERELYATITVNNLINDLNSNIVDVGFLDATNTTLARRQRMINTLHASIPDGKVVILDVQCNSDRLLNYNISCKSSNNDYKDKDYSLAIRDFNERSKNYKKAYQPITQEELDGYGDKVDMYVKCVNAGESFEFSNVKESFVNDEQKDQYPWYDILSSFKDNYYELEGKKYFEKVNNWYN